jgi:hypothetical protein
MATWQTKLKKLVELFDQLPPTLSDAFLIEPSAGKQWPQRLPSCPALLEFYTICDGGVFGYYTLHGLADLQMFEEAEAEAGRYLAIGDTTFGHTLVWDSREDKVGYYDLDGADGFVFSSETGAKEMGLTMDGFLQEVFTPPTHPNQRDSVETMWRQILDRLA